MNAAPHFMKTTLGLLLLTPGALLAQGAFPPATGPTVPIMKTLAQVEPRRAIAASTTTVSISTSGAYYLTGNITVTTDTGINIGASNVSLDLNGYTISSTSSPSSGRGIFIVGGSANIEIFNGNIRGTTTHNGASYQTPGGFNRGITSFANAKNISIHEVNIDGIDGDAITLDNGSGFDTTTVTNCNVTVATGTGIRAGNVQHCTVIDVTNNGIFANLAIGCLCTGRAVSAGLSAISSDVVTDCYATNGTGTGIFSNGNVSNSYGVSSSATGISALTVANSLGLTASGISYGIQSAGIVNHSRGVGTPNSVTGQVVVGSTGTGAVVGTAVKQFSAP
jgi:hypothetical protein